MSLNRLDVFIVVLCQITSVVFLSPKLIEHKSFNTWTCKLLTSLESELDYCVSGSDESLVDICCAYLTKLLPSLLIALFPPVPNRHNLLQPQWDNFWRFLYIFLSWKDF